MTEHIEYFKNKIQAKLEQLPRAIKGDAPKETLDKIVQEIDILKDAKEEFSFHGVRKIRQQLFDFEKWKQTQIALPDNPLNVVDMYLNSK